jgi:LacI family transcriptional regulator
MPTIREVAEKSGVSSATVSHVINDTRYVSDGVRARVLAAMAEIGYRPNALARSLRRGETYTLGLILPDSGNPFFAEIARSIEAAAFDSGYSIILCNTEGNQDRERLYVDVLCNKQVDGIIFVATGDRTDALTQLLCNELPVVLVDRHIPGIQSDEVILDNHQGGYIATQHLVSLGHKRIGCIAGPSTVTPSTQRVTGYQAALVDNGLPVDEALVIRGDFHPGSGWTVAHTLLKFPDPPTAIFACNDMMAIGALRAASETGRRVPADLAIVGFDNIELAAYTTPPLTTVGQPILDMGRISAGLIIERIKDRTLPPRCETLSAALVIRDSCGSHR